jgi:hypothetical protein
LKSFLEIVRRAVEKNNLKRTYAQKCQQWLLMVPFTQYNGTSFVVEPRDTFSFGKSCQTCNFALFFRIFFCNFQVTYESVRPFSYWGDATAIRWRKKSTKLYSWRVVIASWSRWWEKRHYELKVRPVGYYFLDRIAVASPQWENGLSCVIYIILQQIKEHTCIPVSTTSISQRKRNNTVINFYQPWLYALLIVTVESVQNMLCTFRNNISVWIILKAISKNYFCPPTLITSSALDGGDWSTSRSTLLISGGTASVIHWIQNWVGSSVCLNVVVKEKTPPLRESNPGLIVLITYCSVCYHVL